LYADLPFRASEQDQEMVWGFTSGAIALIFVLAVTVVIQGAPLVMFELLSE